MYVWREANCLVPSEAGASMYIFRSTLYVIKAYLERNKQILNASLERLEIWRHLW